MHYAFSEIKTFEIGCKFLMHTFKEKKAAFTRKDKIYPCILTKITVYISHSHYTAQHEFLHLGEITEAK